MNPNYCHTVTLYNCLKARDNPEKKDLWFRTVLQSCFYKASIVRVQEGTEVSMRNTYTVRIPPDGRYLSYSEWKGLPEEKRKDHFTASEGDIIVYGDCTEEITGESGNVAAKVLLRYKPDAFKVTSFSDNTSHRMGKHYRLGG